MHLYLLRHGDAVEQGYDDARRPLSKVGEDQAKLAASVLQHLHATINIILSSPLERAKQTAKIVQGGLLVREVMVTEYLVPGVDQRQIIELLNGLAHERVLLVGHEPQLSTFASVLVEGTTSARMAIKKGSLACIEARLPIERGACVLHWLLGQEQMKLLLGYSSGNSG